VRQIGWSVVESVRKYRSRFVVAFLPWDAAAEVELGVVGAELVAVGGGGDHLAEGREGLGRGLHCPQLHNPCLLLCHLRAGVGAHGPAAC
jgi:hypothetical protein